MIQASRLGIKWAYNRQISDSIAEVPDLLYEVEFFMPHHHRHRKACEEHVRCMISLAPFQPSVVFCDMPVEFFLKLPLMTRSEALSSNKKVHLAVV